MKIWILGFCSGVHNGVIKNIITVNFKIGKSPVGAKQGK